MTNQIRKDLAAAYQICAMLNLDDSTYTHLSSRCKEQDAFYIYPFGLLFEEVTQDNLIKVSFDGEVLEGSEETYNATAYIIHGQIYKARQDLNHIWHLHTHAGVAISAMKDGLRPISQWALHFFNRISYHDYNSLALSIEEQGNDLIRDLGSNNVMLLRNHGTLTCGKTIHETLFYTHHLEQACKTQCLIGNQKTIEPSKDTCEKTVKDLLKFETDLGLRDWTAMLRKLNRQNSSDQFATQVKLLNIKKSA